MTDHDQPCAAVQRQLDANNARDIDTLLSMHGHAAQLAPVAGTA